MARDIARRDGVSKGLLCVRSVLEPCNAFDVRGNHQTHRLQVVRRLRKCLHFYFYFLDPELGFMHVRVQSWLPFTIQIYVNGHDGRYRTHSPSLYAHFDGAHRIAFRYAYVCASVARGAPPGAKTDSRRRNAGPRNH